MNTQDFLLSEESKLSLNDVFYSNMFTDISMQFDNVPIFICNKSSTNSANNIMNNLSNGHAKAILARVISGVYEAHSGHSNSKIAAWCSMSRNNMAWMSFFGYVLTKRLIDNSKQTPCFTRGLVDVSKNMFKLYQLYERTIEKGDYNIRDFNDCPRTIFPNLTTHYSIRYSKSLVTDELKTNHFVSSNWKNLVKFRNKCIIFRDNATTINNS